MNAPLLATERLAIGYHTNAGTHRVARDLCLTIPTGQFVCLLGPNGSGKSTLLRTLAGMHAPLGGAIYLAGQPLDALTAAQRATQLAVVLTEPVATHLSAYDLVAMGRYPYTGWLGRLTDHDRRAVAQAMRVTGTHELAHRSVGTLSDGERQKIMIARAVAQDTPLLLLDEPTAHLDVPNRIAVIRLLHQLTREHRKTVLLSTHALDLAMFTADRLWLMHQGAMKTGVPEDLALDGTLASVFAHDGVRLDARTGSFQLVRPPGRLVGLTGPPPAVWWTQRALERAGFSVGDAAPGVPTVEVVTDPAPRRWIIRQGTDTQEASSVESVLRALSEELPSAGN